jgi:hypothetical protein
MPLQLKFSAVRGNCHTTIPGGNRQVVALIDDLWAQVSLFLLHAVGNCRMQNSAVLSSVTTIIPINESPADANCNNKSCAEI